MKVTPKTKKPNTLQNAVQALNLYDYLSLRRYFSDLYGLLKSGQTGYSYRKFSFELGYGETNFMHLVCSGKRKLSALSAREVANHLGFGSHQRSYFLALVRFENSRNQATRNAALEEIATLIQEALPSPMSKDQFAYFSNWHNVVIRELASRQDFQFDPEWIAQQIVPAIRSETIKESLDLLCRIGYLKEEVDTFGAVSNSKFVPSETHVRSPLEGKSAALFRYHHQMIEHGRAAMTRFEAWRRDISGVTVRIDDDTMKQIKKEIQEFRKRVLELSEKSGTDGQQVYQLNFQFFPFTKATES